MRKKVKEDILRLRAEGKSYNEIVQKLNCSKSTVSFHCGSGQKDKAYSRFLRNKERKNKICASQYRLTRLFTQRYKSLCGCSVCGIKDPRVLEFDHKDPSTKIASVAGLMAAKVSLKQIKEEIRKCDVLCANCHRIKHIPLIV